MCRKKSKEVAAHEFNVNPSSMFIIEGCADCMAGNKRLAGVHTGPHLNAGVQEVLKEINPRLLFQEIRYKHFLVLETSEKDNN